MVKKLKRVPMPKQDREKRRHNFNEVAFGYSEKQALREASRCLECKKAPCSGACPVEIDIPGFIKLIKEKDFLGAARKIKEKNSLPAICGRVCPQEGLCEKLCVTGKKGEPVAIGRLERFVADYEQHTGQIQIPRRIKATGKKVAVIGSGPAGLTLASDLAKSGHVVSIFEALHKPGGVLSYGIPEFRLPKATVNAEVDYVKKLGVEIRTSIVIGKLFTVNELLEKYDAVFIGTGAGLPKFMGIEGENLIGVYSANEFLTRVNLMKGYLFPDYATPIKRGKKLAVVGGGNAAMDASRSALRLGAEHVYDVYRRSRIEMPARNEEIENAEKEGIDLRLLTNPVRIIGDEKKRVKELECIKMKLGEPDESGRRRPIPIKDSEFRIEADVVVIAIGQGANPLISSTTSDLEINKWGYIVADEETGKTSKERVYAGGDIVTGAATVISAMGAGRKAAAAINKLLNSNKRNKQGEKKG